MISVVICTHNGARKIANALRALGNQTMSSFETIVVDDGSSDGVGEVVGGYPVRYLRMEQNVGLSAARNAGVAAAGGEIIAFCDDDCVPEPEWVERIAAVWEKAEPGVMGIGGGVRAWSTHSIAQRYADATSPLAPLESTGGGVVARLWTYLSGPRRGAGSRWVKSLVGANMSYRRTALEAVGGFDPAIKFGGDEEVLCQRLREKYGEECLWFVPQIVMNHEFDERLADTFRRARAYGRGSGREWARNGGIPSFRPGIIGVIGGSGAALLWGWRRGGMGWGIVVAAVSLFTLPLAVAWHTRHGKKAERNLYPHLTILLEAANTLGFYEGWRDWRRQHGSGNR
jgi:glycosyltransferase involved in cell wall biosynthesis